MSRDFHGRAYVRLGTPDRRGRRSVRTYAVQTDRDGEKHDAFDATVDPLNGDFEMWTETTIDRNGMVRIQRLMGQAPDSPRMWFVHVDDSRATGLDTKALVAFDTDHFPDGTIIDEMEFVLLPVTNEQQIAASQWRISTGTVEQVYVTPDARRRDIGRRMGHAAGQIHQVNNWPGVVQASGRRTVLGQQFTVGQVLPSRLTEHTELSPPMDQ